MTIGSKAELKTAILDTLAEDTLPDCVLDRLIAFADTSIKSKLRITTMEATATLPSGTADPALPLPSRFLSLVRAHFDYGGRRYVLEQRAPSGNNALAGGIASETLPVSYAIEGRENASSVMLLAPAPNVSVDIEIVYKADPTLVDDEDSNDILLKYPALYHDAALMHAGAYLKDPAQVAEYKSSFRDMIADIQAIENKDRFDGPMVKPTPPYLFRRQRVA